MRAFSDDDVIHAMHTEQVSSFLQLENMDIFDASLVGSTVIIVYLFREVCGIYISVIVL